MYWLSSNRRSQLIWMLFSIVLSFAPAVWAQDGIRGALSQKSVRAFREQLFEQRLVAADFDSDLQADGAVLIPTGWNNGARTFRIELHLTGNQDNEIDFATSDSELAIAAIDVNRDGAPDIVVEKAFSRKRLQVYLNDGHGRFRRTTSAEFTAPDRAGPVWSIHFSSQSAPMALLSPTRGFGLERASTVFLRDSVIPASQLAGLSLAQGRFHAPSASRAPPTFFTL